MKKVLITGGPKAGKSSVMRALEHELQIPANFVPEAATMVLRSGFRKRPDTKTATAEELYQWSRDFQAAVFEAQMLLERHANEISDLLGFEWAVFDRCEFDGMAYHPDGIGGYGKIFDITLGDMHQKYEAVIFLETLAVAFPEMFDTEGNEHRYEDSAEEAVEVDKKTFALYSTHPNFHHIPSALSLEEKIQACYKIITDRQR